jgi:hypothetical protein
MFLRRIASLQYGFYGKSQLQLLLGKSFSSSEFSAQFTVVPTLFRYIGI